MLREPPTSTGGLSSTIETLIDGLRLGPARTAGPWGGFAGASQAVVPMGLPVLLHAHAPALSPPAMVTAMEPELGLDDPALQLEALDWRRLAQAYERAETLRETREILIEHSISKQV